MGSGRTIREALGDNGYDFGAKTVIVSHDERTADPFEKLVNWIKRER